VEITTVFCLCLDLKKSLSFGKVARWEFKLESAHSVFFPLYKTTKALCY
jgi:hypothetical protein